jgi:hypothetical protein
VGSDTHQEVGKQTMTTVIIERRYLAQIAEQIGSSLMEDTDRYVNRFTVDSMSSSKVYIVSQQRHDGMWCCSCQGWITHHSRPNFKGCKHLNDILRQLSALESLASEQAVALVRSARTAYLDLGGVAPAKPVHVAGVRVLDL